MDIKPENIMVDKNMDPIIIDFGLCGTSHPKNGTTAFHAPEQVVWKDQDPAPFNPLKFDSWQLGMVIYLCLGGDGKGPLFEDEFKVKAKRQNKIMCAVLHISAQA